MSVCLSLSLSPSLPPSILLNSNWVSINLDRARDQFSILLLRSSFCGGSTPCFSFGFFVINFGQPHSVSGGCAVLSCFQTRVWLPFRFLWREYTVFFWRRIAYVYVTVFSFFVINFGQPHSVFGGCAVFSCFQTRVYLPVLVIFNADARTCWHMRLLTGAVRTPQESLHWRVDSGSKNKNKTLPPEQLLAGPDYIFQVSPIPSLFLYHLQLENVSLFLLLIPSVQQQISSNIGGIHIHFRLQPSKTPVDVLSWMYRGQGKWPNR